MSSEAIDYTGSYATAIGWGRTSEGGDLSTKLQKVQLPLLSDEECDEAGYEKSRRTDNMICAGYLEGKRDSCSVNIYIFSLNTLEQCFTSVNNLF